MTWTGHAVRADPAVVVVVQKDRGFDQMAVTMEHGSIIRFLNHDDFDHQMYVSAPQFSFESDEVAPGGSLDVVFPTPGRYQVHCHIHPRMGLDVTVR